MSDQDQPTPPRPTPKTSAVPLKKETVRITLRPQSSEGAAPPPPPGAAMGAPPPPRPVAPTVPLAPPPRPAVGGAPPAPAAARPAPPPGPVGSKTIPLSQPPTRPTTPMAGKPTAKIATSAPAAAQPLPRATVKLQPTASPSAPISSVNVRTASLDDDDELDEGPLNVMGWIALVASVAVLIGVLAAWDKVEFFSEGVVPVRAGDTASRQDAINDWRKAPAPDGFKLPRDFSPFDRKDGNGGATNEYDRLEPKPPEKPAAP